MKWIKRLKYIIPLIVVIVYLGLYILVHYIDGMIWYLLGISSVFGWLLGIDMRSPMFLLAGLIGWVISGHIIGIIIEKAILYFKNKKTESNIQ